MTTESEGFDEEVRTESGEESQENGANTGEESQEDGAEDEGQDVPHSHVLTLANGKTHLWDAAEGEPNGPVPTEIDGVPVVHVAHAGEAV